MPAVSRKGDICTGHGPYPPRASTSGSGDVFANGIAVHRVGDTWAVHQKPPSGPNPHESTLAAGSGTVFVNGKALGRIGDAIACDSAVAQGSANVFSG